MTYKYPSYYNIKFNISDIFPGIKKSSLESRLLLVQGQKRIEYFDVYNS